MAAMEDLRKYLNKKQKQEQEDFAKRCGTTLKYLRKAISKKQELGAELSVNIERESFGEVTRKKLHPKKYLAKWPELAQQVKSDKAA